MFCRNIIFSQPDVQIQLQQWVSNMKELRVQSPWSHLPIEQNIYDNSVVKGQYSVPGDNDKGLQISEGKKV